MRLDMICGIELHLAGLIGGHPNPLGQISRFWQIAIPSALGVTLVVMLMGGFIIGYRPDSDASGQRTDSPAINSTERASLVRAIATLDLRFQEGDLPEPDYRAQRQELLDRILGPGADDFASIRNQAE